MGLADYFKKKATPVMDMKICMMGPRAVGKTTILTAIFNDTQESIGATTKMHLTAEAATSAELTDRKRYLDSIFTNRQNITDRPEAGIAASSTVTTFDFHFGLKGKEPRINLEIKDFPGEYVVSDPDAVMRFIRESVGVFIAIDTPHLMEENGRFNEIKNKPSAITNFFKTTLPKLEGEKLVLLVPLKCERYFNERRMDEVAAKVKESYAELIEQLRKSQRVACAITPILTLGDVEFDSMERDNGGEIAINEFGTPRQVNYRFVGEKAKYNPAFCVQPLYYLLSFIAAQYKRNRSNLDLMTRLIGSIFDTDEELLDEILVMEKNRRTGLPGYDVVCGSDLFSYCK